MVKIDIAKQHDNHFFNVHIGIQIYYDVNINTLTYPSTCTIKRICPSEKWLVMLNL